MKEKLKYPYRLALACVLLCTIFLTACTSSKKINKDFLYFENGTDTIVIPEKQIIIQTGDQLTIQIFSQSVSKEQAAAFNLPLSANNQLQGYTVNKDGNIDMPVIGNMKAAGFSIEELRANLVQKITPHVKYPVVLIRFFQFNVYVLGEVKSPGTQKFQTDKVTIIDAIGAAGDLTDYGKREDITVIREEYGKKIYHKIDLRSKHFFESPVYVLQPNDIVYVNPNKNKLKNLSVDPEAQRKTGLFLAITSVIVSVGTLIITALR